MEVCRETMPPFFCFVKMTVSTLRRQVFSDNLDNMNDNLDN